MSTITRIQNRRTLLNSTALGAHPIRMVTSLTRSGTTATAVANAHAYSAGQWVMIQGSDLPEYNGPKQISGVTDANTFTFELERDPGANSGGSVTSQRMIVGTLWGDGTTTADGNPTVGALSTATGAAVVGRIANAAAPSTPANMGVWSSPSGAPGSWRRRATRLGSPAANGEAHREAYIDPSEGFLLVGFWGNAGQAVTVDAVGIEETSYVATS